MISLSPAEYRRHVDQLLDHVRAIKAMGIEVANQAFGRDHIKSVFEEADFRAPHLHVLGMVRSDFRIAIQAPSGVGGFVSGSFSDPHVTDAALSAGAAWVADVQVHEAQHMISRVHGIDLQAGLSKDQVNVLRRRIGSVVDFDPVAVMEGANEMKAQGGSTQTRSGYKNEVTGVGQVVSFVQQVTGKSILEYYGNGDVVSINNAIREGVMKVMVEEVIEAKKLDVDKVDKEAEDGQEKMYVEFSMEEVFDMSLEAEATTHQEIEATIEEKISDEKKQRGREVDPESQDSQVIDFRSLSEQRQSLQAKAA